jgi:hypothetical protein
MKPSKESKKRGAGKKQEEEENNTISIEDEMCDANNKVMLRFHYMFCMETPQFFYECIENYCVVLII